ncbi:uncharacterized protein LOC110234177 [Exaiptasia diaphana]|uniref:Uncharacterized protein n=1 Tax=Exaiptasia diaphana TaxID=2652724 RepID=A0A913YEE3_EXADI|nr:uncharacterized protein LOC110234177 [Exaiptasia diaphana]
MLRVLFVTILSVFFTSILSKSVPVFTYSASVDDNSEVEQLFSKILKEPVSFHDEGKKEARPWFTGDVGAGSVNKRHRPVKSEEEIPQKKEEKPCYGDVGEGCVDKRHRPVKTEQEIPEKKEEKPCYGDVGEGCVDKRHRPVKTEQEIPEKKEEKPCYGDVGEGCVDKRHRPVKTEQEIPEKKEEKPCYGDVGTTRSDLP